MNVVFEHKNQQPFWFRACEISVSNGPEMIVDDSDLLFFSLPGYLLSEEVGSLRREDINIPFLSTARD